MTGRRTLGPEEQQLWRLVLRTVRPARGRTAETGPAPESGPGAAPETPFPIRPASPKAPPKRVAASDAAAPKGPWPIEPNRRRRIVRERDPIESRLDLHGLDQDAARARLLTFLLRAQAEGLRAVLVITGKGTRGEGVLRRRIADWLADPALDGVVAGAAPADRRHGGDGALYVALKRAQRPGAI